MSKLEKALNDAPIDKKYREWLKMMYLPDTAENMRTYYKEFLNGIADRVLPAFPPVELSAEAKRLEADLDVKFEVLIAELVAIRRNGGRP